MTAVMSGEGMSTRRPSPHHRVVPSPIPALGLSNMDDTMDIKANSPVLNITSSNTRLTERQILQIVEDQAHLRDIGWKALRETLDWFSEKVNLTHRNLEHHPDTLEG